MNSYDLIGRKLKDVIKNLSSYEIVDNSFNVQGEKLVTNVKSKGDKIVLIVSDFIFDVKGKNDGV